MKKSLYGVFGNDQRLWSPNAFYIHLLASGAYTVVMFNAYSLLGVGFWHVILKAELGILVLQWGIE
ncbi:unnamed protein product [Sphenostylis stenocarpa]|uniref:Uncharacterized protein n=1 Tax=Sphenostylis stenocarpa TaxID=92480 RepID=A0AA87B880_9FABA|nr:unnamed protein product [Sphenostylis stenocarpa]